MPDPVTLAGWPHCQRLLDALDKALDNFSPDSVQRENHESWSQRLVSGRNDRFAFDVNRADFVYRDKSTGRTGWFCLTRLADGAKASLEELGSGEVLYVNEMTDEIPGPLAFLEKLERSAEDLGNGSDQRSGE
jgi:hypothetical protein